MCANNAVDYLVWSADLCRNYYALLNRLGMKCEADKVDNFLDQYEKFVFSNDCENINGR